MALYGSCVHVWRAGQQGRFREMGCGAPVYAPQVPSSLHQPAARRGRLLAIRWPFAGHSLNRCRCSCGITSPCARDKLNSPPALLLSSHLGRPHLSCCKGDPVFRRHGQRKWALRCHGRPAVHTAIISWDLSARTPGCQACPRAFRAWRAQWSEWTGPLAVAAITPHASASASASASREPVCTSRLV